MSNPPDLPPSCPPGDEGMEQPPEHKMSSEGAESRPGESLILYLSHLTASILFNRIIFPSDLVAPPTTLPLKGDGGGSQRKKLSAPRISLSLDQSEDDLFDTPDDLDINVDDLDTPDEADVLDYTDHELDWEGETQSKNLKTYTRAVIGITTLSLCGGKIYI